MIQQNKYADHIALHQKCLDILTVREGLVNRLNSAQDNLAMWDRRPDTMFHLMVDRSSIVHNIEIRTMAIKRITAYYEKHAGKVCAMLAPKIEMIDNAWLPKGAVTDPKNPDRSVVDLLRNRYRERLINYELLSFDEKRNPVIVFGHVEAGIAHSEEYGNAELNSHKIPCDFCVKHTGNDFSVIPLTPTT